MRQHRGFTAEQMRRPRDVQEQPIRRIQADQRREAVAPVGDGLQQCGIGFFIRRHDAEGLHHGTGIGQGLAFIKSESVPLLPPAHGRGGRCRFFR